MGVVGRLDQYGSMLTSEFDEITANNPSVTGLGTYYSSEFSENIVDIVRNGLVLNLDAANLSSYPGSGTTWTDVSGGGNNGTLTNGPTYSSANGGSIVFDGSNDYVSTPNSASLIAVGDGSFTLGVWVKLSGTKTVGQSIIRRDNFLNQGAENRRIISLSVAANTNYAGFGVYDGGGNNANGSQNLNDGLWHYLVGVRENSTGTNYIYVDGVLKAQAVYVSSTFNSTRVPYYLGTVSASYVGELFFGNIANTQIYNRALSATEISQNYNALKNRFEILTPSSVTSGLVLNLDAGNPASYPGSGTTWSDISGNGNNGTLVNGPTYSTANGGSIVFDGTNDEVTTTTTSPNIENFSIGAWFKTSTAAGKKIIGFETNQTGTGSTAWDRHIYIGSDGKLYFGLYDGALKVATSPLTYTDNTWHYVVGTYGNEGTTMRLYVDGVSVATNTASSLVQNFNGYWRICGYKTNFWPNATDGYFTGSISNVVVYNRGITAAEVLQNYNSTIERFLTPLTSNFFMRQNRDKSVIVYNEIDEIADIRDIVRSGLVFDLDAGMNTSYPGFGTTWNDISSPPISAATGALPIYNTTDIYGATKDIGTRIDTNASSLVLAVPMNGANNGTTFTDESATIRGSGTAKAITVIGNTKTLTAQSKYYGSSGFFDGSGDYLPVTNSVDFDFSSGAYTIEVWAYPTDVSTLRTIAARSFTGGTGNYSGFILTNQFFYETTTQSSWNVAINKVLTANVWQHLAVVRNGNTWTYYVDGISVGTSTASGSVPTGPGNLEIGRRIGTSDFLGYLQDLRIYKGVAKYTANFTPSGNPTNKIGTLVNGPTYSSANGGSIVFDGVDDYAEITDSSNNFDLGGIDATLEFWIYIPSTSGADVIIGKGGNTTNWNLSDGFIYQVQYDNTNNRFTFIYNNGGGAAGATFIGSGTQPINNWYQVVVVTTTANDIRFYVNTTNIVSATNAISKPTTRTRFRIGTDLSGNYTNARIPVVRFYKNRALTAQEIQQNFNATRSRYSI